MTKLVIRVDDINYLQTDFPSFESFYRHSLDDVIVFSIDGADWVKHGENTQKPTDKAIATHKRFLHHFLMTHSVMDIAILEGCYDGRKEFSYAVSDKLFHTFVQELGYVTEQHSYLLLEVPDTIESNAGVFGTKRAPEIELIENGTGDSLRSYSRIEKIDYSDYPPSSLGWTYCPRSDTFYNLVGGTLYKADWLG
jgi:hypothetical protein